MDLPDLSPDEATAVGMTLTSTAPLFQIAGDCGMSLVEFLRILARPACRSYIQLAREIAVARAQAKAADTRVDALDILHSIATNHEHDIIERRRAASTIINASRPRAAPRPHDARSRSQARSDHRAQAPDSTDELTLATEQPEPQTAEATRCATIDEQCRVMPMSPNHGDSEDDARAPP